MNLNLRTPSLGTVLGCLALMVASAGAATAAGTFVTIQDPTTSSAAKVASNGRLLVGDGNGPLDVIAPRAAPTTMVRGYTEFIGSTACQVLYTPPAGKGAVVTSISASTYSDGNAATKYRLFVSPSATTCSGEFVEILDTDQMVTQDLGTGIVVPSGSFLVANQYAFGGTAVSGVLSAWGYTVPAGQAPAAGPASAPAPGPAGSATGG